MDEFLKAPGTPTEGLFIENRIDELVAMMLPDVALDYSIWAAPWDWGGQGDYPRDQTFPYAVNVIKDDYLAVRRTHLFVTHNVDRVGSYNIPGSYSAAIPNAQPADATLAVVAPNGGEVFVVGETMIVEWTSDGAVESVLVEFSFDHGETWQGVFPANGGNAGQYAWTVPPVDSDQCLIRVSSATRPAVYDTSDASFTVLPMD